jgi:eukaryotic-like serine/threonine-protein kinase
VTQRRTVEGETERLGSPAGSVFAGRYKLERVIGAGQRGIVYLAKQLELDTHVAVKLYRKRVSPSSTDFSQKFAVESAAIARLVHPNVGTVYDFGESENGHPYVVMELVQGRPLSSLVHDPKALPIVRAIEVGVQIARALRAAHSFDLLHGDLSANCIMIARDGSADDDVKVLDFGMASLFGAGARWAQYAAPEVLRGAPASARSDIYAFGVVLYEMITGIVPHPGKDPGEVARLQVSAPPAKLMTVGHRRAVVAALETFVMRCLSRTPDQRPESAADVVGELKAVHRTVTGSAKFSAVPTVEINAIKKATANKK